MSTWLYDQTNFFFSFSDFFFKWKQMVSKLVQCTKKLLKIYLKKYWSKSKIKYLYYESHEVIIYPFWCYYILIVKAKMLQLFVIPSRKLKKNNNYKIFINSCPTITIMKSTRSVKTKNTTVSTIK